MFIQTPAELQKVSVKSVSGVSAGLLPLRCLTASSQPHPPQPCPKYSATASDSLIQQMFFLNLPSLRGQSDRRTLTQHPAASLQRHRSLTSLQSCKLFTGVPEDQSADSTTSTRALAAGRRHQRLAGGFQRSPARFSTDRSLSRVSSGVPVLYSLVRREGVTRSR